MKKMFNLLIILGIAYGIYYFADQTKIFKRIDCLGLGGTPVNVREVGPNILSNDIICAEPTTDANKDCYDNAECTGDCILERYSDEYPDVSAFLDKHGYDKRGYCQPYQEMDCYVSRDRGTIVIKKCDKNNYTWIKK